MLVDKLKTARCKSAFSGVDAAETRKEMPCAARVIGAFSQREVIEYHMPGGPQDATKLTQDSGLFGNVTERRFSYDRIDTAGPDGQARCSSDLERHRKAPPIGGS